MRLAGRELAMRRNGEVIQEESPSVRPMGAMTEENLRRYASLPNPKAQREAARAELERRKAGGVMDVNDSSGFRNMPIDYVRRYAYGTDSQILGMWKERIG